MAIYWFLQENQCILQTTKIYTVYTAEMMEIFLGIITQVLSINNYQKDFSSQNFSLQKFSGQYFSGQYF